MVGDVMLSTDPLGLVRSVLDKFRGTGTFSDLSDTRCLQLRACDAKSTQAGLAVHSNYRANTQRAQLVSERPEYFTLENIRLYSATFKGSEAKIDSKAFRSDTS